MIGCDRHVMFVYAVAALFVAVQSRAVNISNTWMLPEEGFPVFYRYFRDRISWYEADAVCQFHHANLVTADSSSQYDAIRAYLKELDIIEKVWIGLSKPQEKHEFSWTDFRPLSGEGHWQESLPAGEGQSLCVVMDPGADFLWRTLPCGGPEVAAFICELPIPSWALGPKGCLLTELPSLTVLYIPEQSALELTSDCGLDGTKRIACKGDADREEMLRQLTCVIPNEDMDEDKATKTSTSDYFETSTWDDKTTQSLSTNTINSETTRHRRETEDTLSPTSTKSSFKEASNDEALWHQQKVVLTTQHAQSLEEHVTPTPATNVDMEAIAVAGSVATVDSSSSDVEKKLLEDKIKPTGKLPAIVQRTDVTTSSHKILEVFTNQTPKYNVDSTRSTTTAEANVEDYPSAINQGQLFSIIENGTMFDIIELNETEQQEAVTKNATESSGDPKINSGIATKTKNIGQPTKKSIQEATMVPLPQRVTTQGPTGTIFDILERRETSDHDSTRKNATESTENSTTESHTEPSLPTKKVSTKKPLQQPIKKLGDKQPLPKRLITEATTTASVAKRAQSVDEMEENLTKEFEMMPEIKDTSVKLNRTFRKELPATNDEHTALESGGQYGVPRIINFTVSNAIDSEDDGFQQDQPQPDGNVTETLIISGNVDSSEVAATSSVVKKNEPKLHDNEGEKTAPIDPRLYILNHHPNVLMNNHSESVADRGASTEKPKLAKEDFLPKSLLGKSAATTTTPHPTSYDGYSEHPFPSDEPKKVNRHRNLHTNKARKFYPYFFSRMLG